MSAIRLPFTEPKKDTISPRWLTDAATSAVMRTRRVRKMICFFRGLSDAFEPMLGTASGAVSRMSSFRSSTSTAA